MEKKDAQTCTQTVKINDDDDGAAVAQTMAKVGGDTVTSRNSEPSGKETFGFTNAESSLKRAANAGKCHSREEKMRFPNAGSSL